MAAGTRATSSTRSAVAHDACRPRATPSTSAGQVGERRLRALGRRAPGAVAQHADDLAQVLERLVRARADHARRARDLVRRSRGAELQRARVHAQQRDPVREHVVHLARDPRALLLRARSACSWRSASARSARSRSESTSWRRARTNIPHAATATVMLDGDRERDEQNGVSGPGAARSRAATDGERDRADSRDVPERPVDGDREEGDQRRRPTATVETAARER